MRKMPLLSIFFIFLKVNVPESLARRWVAEIVEVVAYIHPKGIVQ